ncbi:unnamed protein product [Durusdinium trenchii]|uniref:Uncharacterized protein n=1 Tax=Durusdinium trenchii TaxID=1381693 RepID=A0ABP0S466_9DINO
MDDRINTCNCYKGLQELSDSTWCFWKMVRAWPRNFGKFQTHVEVELQTLKETLESLVEELAAPMFSSRSSAGSRASSVGSEQPKVHQHAAMGQRKDEVSVACLRQQRFYNQARSTSS